MEGEVYWLSGPARGRIAIVPRPRGNDWLEDEVAAWRNAGLTTIVSLLERSETRDLGLSDEARHCKDRGLTFVPYPIPDRGVPAPLRDAQNLVQRLAHEVENGGSVGIHCRAGIGRSAIIAACILIQLGWHADTALQAVEAARGVPVPDTPDQADWVRAYACKKDRKHMSMHRAY